MSRCLALLISSDELFTSSKDEKRFKSLLDSYRNGRPVDRSDVEWMMDQHKRAYDRYLDSSPHEFHRLVLGNDALMRELENVSVDFQDASKCFGFDVPEYNEAFRNYDQSIRRSLVHSLKTFQNTLNDKDQRRAAGAVKDDLELRAQVAFGAYPEWRFRVPVLTPSTFGAMADTFTKFPCAITEVWLLKHLSMSQRLRLCSSQVVSWIYPMSLYFLPRGGPGTLPRNITSWLFQEIRNKKTSYWTDERASELPIVVGGGPSAL